MYISRVKSDLTILSEAAVVGILLILFVYITHYLFLSGLYKNELPEICKDWNKNWIMEKNIFTAGALFHIAFEYFGINEWYAQNYFLK